MVDNMIPQTTMKTATNVRLPLSFILYGLFSLVVGQIILFLNVDFLLAGSFRIPQIWMAVHFLLLGFAVMIVMGAMYQLVPVAFLAPIWNQTFGFLQLIITAIGIALFATLLGLAPGKALFAGIIVIIGILMFIFQMTKTILKQKDKNMITYFVLGALTCLLLTIVAGFLLVWNMTFTSIGSQQTILYSHISFGVAGWFTLLIFGFSYKLVPMFSLSHGFSMKWAKLAFIMYVNGLIFFIFSFWINKGLIQAIGALFLLIGFSLFVLDIKEILDKRIRKKLDKPFSFSLLAILNGLVLHILALLFSITGMNSQIGWGWLTFLYIMCWIIFSILGYLYKIVPFLWWTHKYSGKIGKENVPTLKEMIDEKRSVILFVLFIVGVVGLTAGALLQMSIAVIVFQGILMVTSIFYTISIIRVLYV